MNSSTHWWQSAPATINQDAREAAEARQDILTKPPGALGRLESLAIRLAAMQGRERPRVDRVDITVFAGDHGVVAEGISAFPQQVTYEMVKNFASGGAAINVLAKSLDATLKVVNLGTVVEADELPGVINHLLGPGTANFTRQAAMTGEQLDSAMQVGRDTVMECRQKKSELFIGGEMGIGNTTAAAALSCALLEVDPHTMAGPGTGLDSQGVAHKAEVIGRALSHHADPNNTPIDLLRIFGGFEIAALTGCYIACAQESIAVLVDGFISSTAALCASRLCAGSEQWFLYSHSSAEPGHRTILAALDAEPVLDLGMRLGEGSGAAVAVPILRLACALHNEMATFAEAGVADG